MSDTGVISIHGHKGYSVTEDGRVLSLDKIVVCKTRSNFSVKGRELKPGIGKNGYKLVVLGRGNPRYIHSLVCEAFHGNRPEGKEVRHLDGNKLNNHKDNLSWGTRKENVADSIAHGTFKGTENCNAK